MYYYEYTIKKFKLEINNEYEFCKDVIQTILDLPYC